MILEGDCLKILRAHESNSIDSLVTDPPAGISFMGKSWDSDKGGRDHWVKWMSNVMSECLRVLKPGAHGLVWALPRTSHWTAMALEDAGFEVRDVITHLFGTGFPKSLDVSKAIDKAAGAEGEIVGKNPAFRERQLEHDARWETAMRPEFKRAPATDAAKKWQGFGTALKPACEMWILVRKPCSEKTVAANVLKHGVGAMNIDASRIEAADQAVLDAAVKRMTGNTVQTLNSTGNFVSGSKSIQPKSAVGRFPANLLFSHDDDCGDTCTDSCAVKSLDEQSGVLKSGDCKPSYISKACEQTAMAGKNYERRMQDRPASSGGASRFFYCAKVSTAERGEGNKHPTVKSVKLMSYLITLITPPNGTVLDPFMGSGSTGIAAKKCGFQFIGIEQEKEYFEIAEKRLSAF